MLLLNWQLRPFLPDSATMSSDDGHSAIVTEFHESPFGLVERFVGARYVHIARLVVEIDGSR